MTSKLQAQHSNVGQEPKGCVLQKGFGPGGSCIFLAYVMGSVRSNVHWFS